MAKEESKEEGKEPKKRNWREVAASRNPDLNLDDDDAVATWLEESFNNADRMNTEREQLNELLTTNPQAAGILTGLSSGMGEDGKPFSLTAYLLDNYWDEIQEARNKEEAVEHARKREAEQLKKVAEDEKRKKETAEKLEAEDVALSEARDATNTDEATVMNMLQWVFGDKDKQDGFLYRAIRHELSKDDWERLLYAFNRDKELETARKDGALESRNARTGGKPHRTFRENMPADLGGGGTVQRDTAEEDPTIARYSKMGRRFQ